MSVLFCRKKRRINKGGKSYYENFVKDSGGKKSGSLTIGANWPHSFFRAAAPNDPHHFWNKGKGDWGGVFLFAFYETGDFIIGRIDLYNV